MKTFEKIVFAFCVLSVASFVASYTRMGIVFGALFLATLALFLFLKLLTAPSPLETKKEDISVSVSPTKIHVEVKRS